MYLVKLNPYEFVLGSQCVPLSGSWERTAEFCSRNGYTYGFSFRFRLFFKFRRSLWILLPMLSETWINMPSRACRRDGRPRSLLFFLLGPFVLCWGIMFFNWLLAPAIAAYEEDAEGET